MELYRRLGFTLPPPSVPAMPPREGAPPEPFGAANTHADFPRGFVELVTAVRPGVGSLPPDVHLVPLEAPPEVLPQLVRRISGTSAGLAALLDRFEGLHILMLAAPDIDAAAARLTSGGERHGGVNSVRCPARTEAGDTVVETVSYLELDGEGPGGAQGRVAEGRVGAVAELDPAIQGPRVLDHPNGAVDLVDAVLCVPDDELEVWSERYGSRLGRSYREEGPARVFDLGPRGCGVTLVPASGLGKVLPGEAGPVAAGEGALGLPGEEALGMSGAGVSASPGEGVAVLAPALPVFVAYAVAVRDLAAARDLLDANGFHPRRTASGDVFVPAAEALGAAVVFRQA